MCDKKSLMNKSNKFSCSSKISKEASHFFIDIINPLLHLNNSVVILGDIDIVNELMP